MLYLKNVTNSSLILKYHNEDFTSLRSLENFLFVCLCTYVMNWNLFLLYVLIHLVSTRINRCVRMIIYAFLDVHSDICQAQLHVLPSRVQFIHRTLKKDNYTSTATYVYQILFQTIGWILIKYTCVGIVCPIYM